MQPMIQNNNPQRARRIRLRNPITGRMVQSSQANHRSIVLQMGRDRERRVTELLDSVRDSGRDLNHVSISQALNPHEVSGQMPRQILWHLMMIKRKEYSAETNEFHPVYRPILTERAVLPTDSKCKNSGYKSQLVRYYTIELRGTEKPVDWFGYYDPHPTLNSDDRHNPGLARLVKGNMLTNTTLLAPIQSHTYLKPVVLNFDSVLQPFLEIIENKLQAFDSAFANMQVTKSPDLDIQKAYRAVVLRILEDHEHNHATKFQVRVERSHRGESPHIDQTKVLNIIDEIDANWKELHKSFYPDADDYVNSDKWDKPTETDTITVYTFAPPQFLGSGRMANSSLQADAFINKKQSVIRIKNTNDDCVFIAMALGLALEQGPNVFTKSYKSLIAKSSDKLYRYIKSKYQELIPNAVGPTEYENLTVLGRHHRPTNTSI